jgi:hypothetical protein
MEGTTEHEDFYGRVSATPERYKLSPQKIIIMTASEMLNLIGEKLGILKACRKLPMTLII